MFACQVVSSVAMESSRGDTGRVRYSFKGVQDKYHLTEITFRKGICNIRNESSTEGTKHSWVCWFLVNMVTFHSTATNFKNLNVTSLVWKSLIFIAHCIVLESSVSTCEQQHFHLCLLPGPQKEFCPDHLLLLLINRLDLIIPKVFSNPADSVK